MQFKMNIANKITLVRLLAIPVFLIFIYIDAPWSNVIATVVFAVASISDFVDGYVARKYDLVTDFGKVIDPVADKILVASALIALVGLGRLPGWIAILMLARDFTVGAVRDLSASKGNIIPAGIWGKLKTAFQMTGVGMLTFNESFLMVKWSVVGTIVIYIALILSIYSGYVYVKEYLSSNKLDF